MSKKEIGDQLLMTLMCMLVCLMSHVLEVLVRNVKKGTREFFATNAVGFKMESTMEEPAIIDVLNVLLQLKLS